LILKLLGWVALLVCIAIYAPILGLVEPLLTLDLPLQYQQLFALAEFYPALLGTLVSTLGSLVLALALSYWLMGALVFTQSYHRFTRQLPILLAIPHLAFAVGLYLLLSPKGWLERLLYPLDIGVWVQDSFGLSLAVALGIKESWFLCWMIWSQLQRSELADQFLVAQTLGYKRAQIIRTILALQLLPKLRWPLVAVAAYSLSSVEMASILGPTHPPTLALLAWRWLLDPVVEQQQLGQALSFLLLTMLLILVLLIWSLPKLMGRQNPNGDRSKSNRVLGRPLLWSLLALHLVLGLLVLLWSVAHSWFYPALLPGDWSLRAWHSLALEPLVNSLVLGVGAALFAMVLVLLVLELNPLFTAWLLLPLFLPVLPVVVSQYFSLLRLDLAPSGWVVLVSHLLWVVPYVYLVLKPAYLGLPEHHLLCARSLGVRPLQLFFRLKLPLLLRPLSAAFALGFSVSLAQYLPTVFLGGGRIETLTTETLTRFSGGDKRILGAQALLLLMVALLVFGIAQRLPQMIYPNRKAMH